jgi:hypothetical protein
MKVVLISLALACIAAVSNAAVAVTDDCSKKCDKQLQKDAFACGQNPACVSAAQWTHHFCVQECTPPRNCEDKCSRALERASVKCNNDPACVSQAQRDYSLCLFDC